MPHPERPSRAAQSAPCLAATLCGLFLALSGCAASPPQAPRPARLVSAGEGIALENCGQCHTIGERGPSALPDAPPFRILQARYSRDQMAALLAGRMAEIHPRMPLLKLDDDQVAALLDYWAASGPRR